VRRGASAARGFTLIELMVTMTVLVVLTLVAAPSFNNALLSNRLTGFANNFVASANIARSEAVKRNSAMTLCPSADAATCAVSGGWHQGWIVMCKYATATPGVCDSAGTNNLVIYTQASLATGYHFTGTQTSIVFQPAGGVTAADVLTLCRASPVGSQERAVTVKASGRVSVATTRTGSCS
jgi:type IV fimbrial biogenesis protein FimT